MPGLAVVLFHLLSNPLGPANSADPKWVSPLRKYLSSSSDKVLLFFVCVPMGNSFDKCCQPEPVFENSKARRPKKDVSKRLQSEGLWR